MPCNKHHGPETQGIIIQMLLEQCRLVADISELTGSNPKQGIVVALLYKATYPESLQ